MGNHCTKGRNNAEQEMLEESRKSSGKNSIKKNIVPGQMNKIIEEKLNDDKE